MEYWVLLFHDGLSGFYECFTIGWVCFHIEVFYNNLLNGLADNEVFFCMPIIKSISYL